MTEPSTEQGDDKPIEGPEEQPVVPKEEAEDDEQEEADEEDEEEDDDQDDDEDEDDDEEEDEEDDDEEPRLKCARLTSHLNPVYRNGDATSSFLVAGDKMIIGTHNGIIHVIQLPLFQSLRVYQAHTTSVTSVSISPYPPPLPSLKPEGVNRAASQAVNSPRPSSKQSEPSTPSAAQRKSREPPPVPNTPSNNIYIATSSQDGNVCVQSLIDMKDVSLRNFARPVQSVAISPDYKNDKTYLSGGLAGNLILTVGAPQRSSTSTTVGTTAAAAAGWLGTVGLSANTGKDSILHKGEGTISTIKWSLSGKFVVWLNETGIKIMRTRNHLESADIDDAWKRIGHIDRPQTDEWEEMAGVWKGRAEWIDESAVLSDDDEDKDSDPAGTLSPAAMRLRQTAQKSDKKAERLVVGWGGTIWIIHVLPGGVGVGKNAGERSAGKAELVKKLRMDCIISGISLYTQSLLLVLAYCKPDEEDEEKEETASKQVKGHKATGSTTSTGSQPSGGIKRRQNALPPELRLINLQSQTEVNEDGELPVTRFERLSSNDYHLAVLPARNVAHVTSSRGTLEALTGLGNDMWNAAVNPMSLFSSGASIKSKDSNEGGSNAKAGSTSGSIRPIGKSSATPAIHPNLVQPGAKIFIHSPYDCILATRRDRGDHLSWLLERHRYQEAWELLDQYPEIVNAPLLSAPDEGPSTPTRNQSIADDFYEDTSSMVDFEIRALNSSAEKEKRRIADSWLEDLVKAGEWAEAGRTASKVINTPDRWEKWIYTFAGAKKFDEIAPYIPSEPMRLAPIPGTCYEIMLNHYIQVDKARFKELLEKWDLGLFNLSTIITALENQLKYRDVREDSVEDGEKGRDWRIVMDGLARLYEASGRYREALACNIKLQDADAAMRLIRDNHLAEAVTDDVASFIALRVPESPIELSGMSITELEAATDEAITLLVEEAYRGLIRPDVVVSQLESKDLNLYLYFYLRGLWDKHRDEAVDDSTLSLVDNFADLAIHLFVQFNNRELLMDFLRSSTSYTFEKAAQECEDANFIPELVYLYSKTGQMKRALYLIIDRLGNVSQAIAFAKDQDDPDLWEDLLEYSMDKPRFIRGLLEEVGTSIDPVRLVRRIPEGLEIPGLREGLMTVIKDHEIQYSISDGVARVLRSEVAAKQEQLQLGQRKGVKFDVMVQNAEHVDVEVSNVPTATLSNDGPVKTGSASATPKTDGAGTPSVPELVEPGKDVVVSNQAKSSEQQPEHDHREPQPGHCAKCHEPFIEVESQTLVGFTCGHVFHLTHLLEYLHPGKEIDSEDVEASGSEDRTRGGRFVGSKVTHARLLRDKISGGCPVCKQKKEAV